MFVVWMTSLLDSVPEGMCLGVSPGCSPQNLAGVLLHPEGIKSYDEF